MPEIPTHTATRYLQPLREGGSLPAVVDTESGGLFVVKFRGAGQGAKALLAELIAGLLAAELGLPVPEALLLDPIAERELTSADEVRERYVRYLAARLRAPRPFLDEAVQARERALREPPRFLPARR